MTTFNIALLQISPTSSIDGNLAKGIDYCRQAKAMNADLALFPEAWQVGYAPELMNIEHAIDNSHPFVAKHIQLAKELQMAIAITFIKKYSTGPKNCLLVIDCHGKIILEYAKVHICDFKPDGTEQKLTAGEKFSVSELDYGAGTIKLGAMICMDREFCESARTLSLNGAELVIVPNSCPLATDDVLGNARLAGFRAMGYQELLGVAMTNYPAPKNDGHSCAFDNLSKQIVMADDREQIVIAEFDVEHLRKIRSEEWVCRGQPARKTKAYNILGE